MQVVTFYLKNDLCMFSYKYVLVEIRCDAATERQYWKVSKGVSSFLETEQGREWLEERPEREFFS